MKKKKGFTLVELIATMAVMSIAITMIINAFSSTVKLKNIDGANVDTVQNLKIAQSYLYNDIRKSVTTLCPSIDAASGLNIFPNDDEKIDNINKYCEAMGYSELIYLTKIDGTVCSYALKKYGGTLHKITIPVDTHATDTTPSKYYPDSYKLDESTGAGDPSTQKWGTLTEEQFQTYISTPPADIIPQSSVVYDNIKITVDSINNVYYDKFTYKLAYTSNTGSSYVILQNQELNTPYPYFQVKLTSKQITFYSGMEDRIVAKGIDKDGTGDAITITPSTSANITAGKYYNIHIDGKIGKSYNSIDTRVALVDYTM